MPRQPRLDLPGIAMHLVQRGNNRQACFFADADYCRYLRTLQEAALEHRCRVHAYVLMTNHVHLLVTPSEARGVSLFMQFVGRRYVSYFNATYARSGTLWEGRFKSCLVDSDDYILACCRYIELNPVRAAMVCAPGDYRWSSYHANAMGRADPLVTPHECLVGLGPNAANRESAYRRHVALGIADAQLADIREYVQQQRAFGSERFRAQIEQQLERSASVRPQGRPRARPKGI